MKTTNQTDAALRRPLLHITLSLAVDDVRYSCTLKRSVDDKLLVRLFRGSEFAAAIPPVALLVFASWIPSALRAFDPRAASRISDLFPEHLLVLASAFVSEVREPVPVDS